MNERRNYKKTFSPARQTEERLARQTEERLDRQTEERIKVLWKQRKKVLKLAPEKIKIEVASIPRLLTDLWNMGRGVQLHAIRYLRQILYSDPCAAEVVISSKVVLRFVEFLRLKHHPELQLEAVLCLKIISSKHPQVLVEYFAVPVLVRLVSCSSYKISHEAICTLGYVAITGPQWRAHVIISSAFNPVVARLDELLGLKEPFMLEVCSWTFASFCKGKLNTDKTRKALMIIKKLLEKKNYAVVINACWAVHDISEREGGVQAVIDTGIYSVLAYLLKRNYGTYTPAVLIPMLLTLQNILEEDDTEFQNSPKIMSGALMSILSRNNDKCLQKSVFNIISNLVVVSTPFIQCMFDNGIVDHLLKYLDMVAKRSIGITVDELKECDVDETYEAALALSHLASNTSSDQIRKLVERGCIKQLCYLLSKQNPRQDPRVVTSCLDGIQHLLNAGEGCEGYVTCAFSLKDKESIEDLCGHRIHVISESATIIQRRISNRLN